jgi:hypothetical protein
MIKVKMKVSDKEFPLAEMTKKECEKEQGSFCYMHPDREPNSAKPKKNQPTKPTEKLKTVAKPVKPPVKAKEQVEESSLLLDEKIISDKNRLELRRKLYEVSPELRGFMLDYIEELKDQGALETALKRRHFIREFMDHVIDQMEDASR